LTAIFRGFSGFLLRTLFLIGLQNPAKVSLVEHLGSRPFQVACFQVQLTIVDSYVIYKPVNNIDALHRDQKVEHVVVLVGTSRSPVLDCMSQLAMRIGAVRKR